MSLSYDLARAESDVAHINLNQKNEICNYAGIKVREGDRSGRFRRLE